MKLKDIDADHGTYEDMMDALIELEHRVDTLESNQQGVEADSNHICPNCEEPDPSQRYSGKCVQCGKKICSACAGGFSRIFDIYSFTGTPDYEYICVECLKAGKPEPFPWPGPCGKCGGDAGMSKAHYTDDGYAVSCSECGVVLAGFRTEAEALAMWDRLWRE